MSTKTLRKRIALVAVSAVGFGVLSAVAANATALNANETAYISTVASATGKGAPNASVEAGTSFGLLSNSAASVTAGSTATGTMLSTGQVSFSFASAANAGVVVTGGIIGDSAAITAVSADGTKAWLSQVNTGGAVMVKNNGTAAGSTILVQFFKGSGITSTSSASNGTLIGQFALTVASAGASDVISTSKSTYIVDTSSSFANTVDQAAGFTVANGGTGYITVAAKDAYGVSLVSGNHAFTVTSTNGALVGFSLYPGKTSAVSTGLPTGIYVNQPVANAPLTTDITLNVDGVVVGTKTLTLVGDLAKIVPSVVGIAKKGNTTATGLGSNEVITFKAYDAAGNRISTPNATSLKGTNAVISAYNVDTATTSSTTGVISVTASDYGTDAALYLQATNAGGTDIKSAVFSVSSAGDAYTYTAKLDKSVYHMGDVATLTITAKDSKGNLANDITALGTSTLKPSIGGGGLTAVNAPLYTDATANGVITYQYIVGNTAGSYSAAVDLPLLTSASGNGTDTTKTVSWTVSSDGSVSNADVLSAIVKLIASINKQIAALQKSLKK
jgi:hypothetical protein